MSRLDKCYKWSSIESEYSRLLFKEVVNIVKILKDYGLVEEYDIAFPLNSKVNSLTIRCRDSITAKDLYNRLKGICRLFHLSLHTNLPIDEFIADQPFDKITIYTY